MNPPPPHFEKINACVYTLTMHYCNTEKFYEIPAESDRISVAMHEIIEICQQA